MNTFKLMVDQRHFDERIERRRLVIVDEPFKTGHRGIYLLLFLRRDIDNLLIVHF